MVCSTSTKRGGTAACRGKRHLTGWLFLFVVKKEPKNRHRFEAVDADRVFFARAAMPPDGAQRHAKKQRAALFPKLVGRAQRPMVGGETLLHGMRPPYDGLLTGLGA